MQPKSTPSKFFFSDFFILLFIINAIPVFAQKEITLLNVSYDPTREFYQEFNAAFAKHWKEKTGQAVSIKQSHGGSSKHAP